MTAVTQTSGKNDISICDIMKEGTSRIIKKMEMQIPSYIQCYSDTYTEYLRMLDDLFGTCYISEKQFFDKFNIEHDALKQYDSFFKSIADMYSEQIDISTNVLRNITQMRISNVKTCENYVRTMLDSYAKILAYYNSAIEK